MSDIVKVLVSSTVENVSISVDETTELVTIAVSESVAALDVITRTTLEGPPVNTTTIATSLSQFCRVGDAAPYRMFQCVQVSPSVWVEIGGLSEVPSLYAAESPNASDVVILISGTLSPDIDRRLIYSGITAGHGQWTSTGRKSDTAGLASTSVERAGGRWNVVQRDAAGTVLFRSAYSSTWAGTDPTDQPYDDTTVGTGTPTLAFSTLSADFVGQRLNVGTTMPYDVWECTGPALTDWAQVFETEDFDPAGSAAAVTPTSLGLVIGTNVQAYAANLTSWAGKTPYAGTITITTGKTFDCTGTLVLSGTDRSTLNIGTGGTLGTAAYTAATAYDAAGAAAAVTLTTLGVSSFAQTLTDDMTAAAARATLGAAPLAAVRHVFWPAGAAIPRITNGAAAGTVETVANHVMYDTYDFDSATAEGIAWVGYLEHWNLSTIKIVPVWTASAGTVTETAILSFKARQYSNDEAIDQYSGTPQTSSDALLATGDIHIGPATSALTVAGTLASTKPIILQAIRDISDTLAGDLRLMGIWIEYTEATTEEGSWA